MEHIEFAGVHSWGCKYVIIPNPVQPSGKCLRILFPEYSKKIAISLKILGLININYAVRNDVVLCFRF